MRHNLGDDPYAIRQPGALNVSYFVDGHNPFYPAGASQRIRTADEIQCMLCI